MKWNIYWDLYKGAESAQHQVLAADHSSNITISASAISYYIYSSLSLHFYSHNLLCYWSWLYYNHKTTSFGTRNCTSSSAPSVILVQAYKLLLRSSPEPTQNKLHYPYKVRLSQHVYLRLRLRTYTLQFWPINIFSLWRGSSLPAFITAVQCGTVIVYLCDMEVTEK